MDDSLHAENAAESDWQAIKQKQVACSRSRDAPGSVVIELVRRFRKEMATANAKEYVTDLTKDEACAICFFAEVPYSLDGESITFHACGLQKRNGVWTAFTSPNVEDRHPASE